MDYKPGDIFVGIIDFFAILLPGALLTFAYADFAKEHIFGVVLPPLATDNLAITATVFLFASYVLGHFAFFLGASLDTSLYDSVHAKYYKKDVPLIRSAIGLKEASLKEAPSYLITRQTLKKIRKKLHSKNKERQPTSWQKFKQAIKTRLFRRTLTDEEEAVALLEPLQDDDPQKKNRFLEQVIKQLKSVTPINEKTQQLLDEATWHQQNYLPDLKHYSPPVASDEEASTEDKPEDILLKETAIHFINAFQWSKAYVELKAPGAAVEIHRHEANSKFFRSLMVVLVFILPIVLYKSRQHYDSVTPTLGIVILIGGFIFGGWLIYFDQRRKAIRAAYQYFIILTKTEVKPETTISHQ